MIQDDNAPLPVEPPDTAPPPLESADELEPLPIEAGDELEPLPLAEEGDSDRSASKIQAFGRSALASKTQQQLNRSMNLTGTGATRCRVFHSKITVASIDHMAGQINEWLDESDIEVKHVAEVVGVMEGKKNEQNLILTVWY